MTIEILPNDDEPKDKHQPSYVHIVPDSDFTDGDEPDEEEKDGKKKFRMPMVHCGKCDKPLKLKPMTLYCRCSGCGSINQIIRNKGNFFSRLYTKKKKLRESLIDNEEGVLTYQEYRRQQAEEEVKLGALWQFVNAMWNLDRLKEEEIRTKEWEEKHGRKKQDYGKLLLTPPIEPPKPMTKEESMRLKAEGEPKPSLKDRIKNLTKKLLKKGDSENSAENEG